MNTRQSILLGTLVACGLAAGCGSSTPASFQPRESVETLMRASAKSGNARAAVDETVIEYFGTPSDLVAWERLPIDYSTNAAGEPTPEPGDTLAAGRRLYMEHCMHCHGVDGDGAGPTARYINNPKPRDYRLGKFKFTSTTTTFKARTEDLDRTVREGIPGTYMPSFLLLRDDELHAIVEYVKWLSCRGELELQLVSSIGSQFGYSQEDYDKAGEDAVAEGEELSQADRTKARKTLADNFDRFMAEGDDDNGSMSELVDAIGEVLDDTWTSAETPEAYIVPTIPRPEPTPESIARGREVFLGAKAKCVNCHGRAGKGDGPQTTAFQTDPATKQEYPEPGLFDDWGHTIKPRNLTLGLYRGGRRPIDLFRRVHAGVKGTPMAGFGGPLSDAEIWDVVNYVMSIPFDDDTSLSDPAPLQIETPEAPATPEAAPATDETSTEEAPAEPTSADETNDANPPADTPPAGDDT